MSTHFLNPKDALKQPYEEVNSLLKIFLKRDKLNCTEKHKMSQIYKNYYNYISDIELLT